MGDVTVMWDLGKMYNLEIEVKVYVKQGQDGTGEV